MGCRVCSGPGGFAREKGALKGGKTAAGSIRRKEILAPKAGAEGSILWGSFSWNSLAER
jgi:hypothetical protein